MMGALLLLALVQQNPQTTTAPSPVARIVVSPRQLTVPAGETLQLKAEAFDNAGRPVPNVTFLFQPQGAWFEATVDSLGVVTAGSTGVFPIAITAVVPGAAPKMERISVQMVPGAAARIDIKPEPPVLVTGQRLRLNARALSRTGDERTDPVSWTSSAPAVARVSADGLVQALAPGRAVLSASNGTVRASHEVRVFANTIASLEITPDRTRARQGDVVRFRITARDARGQNISNVTPTWSFSPGDGLLEQDGSFVGYLAGTYTITASLGARSTDAIVTLGAREVTRPITVVGRLPRSLFTTEEVWVHPNGKVAYLGTGGGGDRMYAIDISNPAAPVVVDSIVANTRRVNDIMTTPDGKFLVFTREGAADRKNGIVIASLEDPLHPKPISEFTDGVTAGVHSAFVFQQPTHGTHIYLTNDGTGALHIIDINDPYKPREVAQFRSSGRPDAGRTLHDVDVQNGLAYLSYWNDNLVVLDVGNGMKGGSPSNPQVVSQYKYDLNKLYQKVEDIAGPGFIRGTHTAWRHRNYVFIADEVFPAGPVVGGKVGPGDEFAGRAFGRLQVLDVSDLSKPKAVAWFEPDNGGVHNVWVAGDTLYVGAYNGGFFAYDVSGELKGDLKAQGREIAHLNTADMNGVRQNSAMTWGVVAKDGLAFVNDMYNGLWIVRLEPKRPKIIP
ncbi:MAG: Ig-like domain-containing protein [Longimicrobiales bacterium]